MSAAILTITPLLDGSRRVTVECEHATTLGGDLHTAPLREASIVAFVLLRHRRGTNCRCVNKLEDQYPAALIPADLMVAEVLP